MAPMPTVARQQGGADMGAPILLSRIPMPRRRYPLASGQSATTSALSAASGFCIAPVPASRNGAAGSALPRSSLPIGCAAQKHEAGTGRGPGVGIRSIRIEEQVRKDGQTLVLRQNLPRARIRAFAFVHPSYQGASAVGCVAPGARSAVRPAIIGHLDRVRAAHTAPPRGPAGHP